MLGPFDRMVRPSRDGGAPDIRRPRCDTARFLADLDRRSDPASARSAPAADVVRPGAKPVVQSVAPPSARPFARNERETR